MRACRSFVARYGAVHIVCAILASVVRIGALVAVTAFWVVERARVRFKCPTVVIVIVPMAKISTPHVSLVRFQVVDVIVGDASRLKTMVMLTLSIATTFRGFAMIPGTSRRVVS